MGDADEELGGCWCGGCDCGGVDLVVVLCGVSCGGVWMRGFVTSMKEFMRMAFIFGGVGRWWCWSFDLGVWSLVFGGECAEASYIEGSVLHHHAYSSALEILYMAKIVRERAAPIVLTIPSICDSVPLQCRLFNPAGKDVHACKRVAVIAHPYAPLGGSYDDHVVTSLAETALDAAFRVMTFNFRGARGSNGKTSWTSNPEQADYTTIVGFLLLYSLSLCSACMGEDEASLDLVMAGYSYGSMIASRQLPGQTVHDQFYDAKEGSREARVTNMAKELAIEHSKSVESSVADHKVLASASRRNIHTRFLLISPVLPPLSSFLSLRWNTFAKSGRPVYYDHPTLSVIGGSDSFTSAGKFKDWAAKAGTDSSASFEHCIVAGADHFWAHKELQSLLKDHVRLWLLRDIC